MSRTEPARRLHLGIFYPETSAVVDWSHPNAGPLNDFDTYRHTALKAQEGLFDALFLGEGALFPEHFGALSPHNVYGEPDRDTILAALAALTTHLGLVATINTAFSDPYDIARRLATLDHLSDGRVGWNVVTSAGALKGEYFERGDAVAHEDRYRRAEANLVAVRAILDAWPARGLSASYFDELIRADVRLAPRISVHSSLLTVDAPPVLPPSRQQRPVIFQAGESNDGLAFSSRYSDALFVPYQNAEDLGDYAHRLETQLARVGRSRASIKVLPRAYVIVGDSTDDARDQAEAYDSFVWRDSQVRQFLERAWGRTLPDLDLDGPLPEEDPVFDQRLDSARFTLQKIASSDRLRARIDGWRSEAAERGWSARQFVRAKHPQQGFFGTGEEVANSFISLFERGLADGFLVHNNIPKHTVDQIVDRVVPILQDRGVYPRRYASDVLARNLGAV